MAMHGINQQFDYDLAVVGGGSAGYAAARPPPLPGFCSAPNFVP
jgi:hypothetical protein